MVSLNRRFTISFMFDYVSLGRNDRVANFSKKEIMTWNIASIEKEFSNCIHRYLSLQEKLEKYVIKPKCCYLEITSQTGWFE